MSKYNEVLITISGTKTKDIYYSKTYPDRDYDDDGREEYYKTPVYKVIIANKHIKKEWKALRFMPYWNDPKKPRPGYKHRGWINSGLSSLAKKAVTYYDPTYGTRNRMSPFPGGIQIKGNFLIHAGPKNLLDYGWGAAGCVEIIGNFDLFKEDIRLLSGAKIKNVHQVIADMVKARKLFVEVEFAPRPSLKP